MANEQKGIGDLINTITGSNENLSTAAALLALVGLLLPFVGVSTNLGMGVNAGGSMNGFAAAGWAAWLSLIAFIAAAAARRVPDLAAYRNLIDMAALALAVFALIWAWFFNPVRDGLGQLEGMFAGAAVASPNAVSFYPHIGMLLFVVAGGLLGLAWKKAAA